ASGRNRRDRGHPRRARGPRACGVLLAAAVQLVDRLLELLETRRSERADRPVGVDDDVGGHPAHAEFAGELAAWIEQDRPLDPPHLAEALDLGAGLGPFPDVHQHYLETRPSLLANAHILEERRFRVAWSSPGREEIEDVLLLRPVVVRALLA